MEMKVSDHVGLNINSSAIYFGKVTKGTTAERRVNFTNNYKFPVKVEINTGGNISEFVSVSENQFIIYPGEEKNIIYYAKPHEDTPMVTYTGITRVVYKRALFSWFCLLNRKLFITNWCFISICYI